MIRPFEYVISYYGVPAAMGRRVTVQGKPGTIIQDRGHLIGVNFDHDKPGRVSICHPTSDIVYHDEIREPRKLTPGQRRYMEWLYSDTGMPFIEWLRWRQRNAKEAKP